MYKLDQVYGELNYYGNVILKDKQFGDAVVRLDANIYPINNNGLSCRYENPAGHIITLADAIANGIEVEK